MQEIIDNCCYDKIKIMHDLCRLLWFIKKHAHEDVKHAGDTACSSALVDLEKDLERHIKNFKGMLCKSGSCK